MALLRGIASAKVPGGTLKSLYPVSISKQRGQGILRQIGILEKKGEPANKGRGEVNAIRTLVAMGEGFQMPVNFKVEFAMPQGIDQKVFQGGGPRGGGGYAGNNTSQVKSGGLDWQTHLMNNSTKSLLKQRFDAANKSSQGVYHDMALADLNKRAVAKMELYCSKISIPEKSINTVLLKHYGAPFPYPQSVQYGTLSTTFYCDGTMDIKKYFDVWQKLIYNDQTGNFNYYNEYIADFNIFTRASIATNKQMEGGGANKKSGSNWATNISDKLKEGTREFDKATGVDPGKKGKQSVIDPPTVAFTQNYGVKIFDCFPQIVGEISLAHDATDSIATFDVTWSYLKWNPFKMGGVNNRQRINLAIGEYRNEKDGFPFIEDLPPELSGPMTGAIDQGIVTGPLSKGSNFLG